jgi:hypothetical protein
MKNIIVGLVITIIFIIILITINKKQTEKFETTDNYKELPGSYCIPSSGQTESNINKYIKGSLNEAKIACEANEKCKGFTLNNVPNGQMAYLLKSEITDSNKGDRPQQFSCYNNIKRNPLNSEEPHSPNQRKCGPVFKNQSTTKGYNITTPKPEGANASSEACMKWCYDTPNCATWQYMSSSVWAEPQCFIHHEPSKVLPGSTTGIDSGSCSGGSSTPTKQCAADYGVKVGDKVCCGQKGTLSNLQYACPKEMPKCVDYIFNKQWGKCIAAENSNQQCAADYGVKVGDKVCCGQKGTLSNLQYACPKEMPKCVDYIFNKQWGKCIAAENSNQQDYIKSLENRIKSQFEQSELEKDKLVTQRDSARNSFLQINNSMLSDELSSYSSEFKEEENQNMNMISQEHEMVINDINTHLNNMINTINNLEKSERMELNMFLKNIQDSINQIKTIEDNDNSTKSKYILDLIGYIKAMSKFFRKIMDKNTNDIKDNLKTQFNNLIHRINNYELKLTQVVKKQKEYVLKNRNQCRNIPDLKSCERNPDCVPVAMGGIEYCDINYNGVRKELESNVNDITKLFSVPLSSSKYKPPTIPTFHQLSSL